MNLYNPLILGTKSEDNMLVNHRYLTIKSVIMVFQLSLTFAPQNISNFDPIPQKNYYKVHIQLYRAYRYIYLMTSSVHYLLRLTYNCYQQTCSWVVEYPKEVILFPSSQQLYFVFQWIRRLIFLKPF